MADIRKTQDQVFDAGLEISKHMRTSAQSGYLRTVAMQPVIDRNKSIYAFEALYRAGLTDRFTGDPHMATRIMTLNWPDFGLQNIAGDARVFFNCTQRAIEEGLMTRIPSSVVIELLENIIPTEALIEACLRMKGMGYEISLDDFQYAPGMETLMEIADYIKIDFRATDREQRRALLGHLRHYRAALVAEKIETRDEFDEAFDDGYHLFQGFFIGKPVLFTRRTFVSAL